jgi:hypothetical protein
VPDVRKAPLQVLLDPDPAVSESEHEPLWVHMLAAFLKN